MSCYITFFLFCLCVTLRFYFLSCSSNFCSFALLLLFYFYAVLPFNFLLYLCCLLSVFFYCLTFLLSIGISVVLHPYFLLLFCCFVFLLSVCISVVLPFHFSFRVRLSVGQVVFVVDDRRRIVIRQGDRVLIVAILFLNKMVFFRFHIYLF